MGVKIVWGTNLGGSTNLRPLKSLGFQQLSFFVIFWIGSKNSLDYFEKNCGNIG